MTSAVFGIWMGEWTGTGENKLMDQGETAAGELASVLRQMVGGKKWKKTEPDGDVIPV